MANLLPSFLSSSKLEIRIGDSVFAYAQALTFTDEMSVMPVGGIGSFNYHTLEPVGYMGRGTMTITHYSSKAVQALKNIGNFRHGNDMSHVPTNLKDISSENTAAVNDGNSLLRDYWFNPINLLLSTTFDVSVYERDLKPIAGKVDKFNFITGGTLLYTMSDCRMTNYSISFTPGSFVNETVAFVCLGVADHGYEDLTKFVKPE